MSLAIVIKSPQPTNNCFIAMPFSQAFAAVYADILQAIAPHYLQPIKLDIMQPRVNFVEDIIKGIRSAKIIIAVCSPEPQTGKPNPNVMYELGMAHALGKPTLILTTDPDKLPADLRSHYALKYDPAQLGTDISINNIKGKVDDLFFRLARQHANPLTDSAYSDISVVPQIKLLLLDHDFWSNFLNILSFGRHIRDVVQPIRATYIAILHKAVYEMMENPNVLSSIKSFNSAWEDYSSSFQDIMRSRIFDSPPYSPERVEESFNFLAQHIHLAIQERVSKSRKFYTIINNLLQKYVVAHESIEDCLVFGALPFPPPEDMKQTVFDQVNNLYANTRNIIVQTDALIVNLIELIQKIGE